MKPLFYTKTLIALVVAVAAAAASISQAQEQPMPPPAGDAALPANIPPDGPVAQVVKLVQNGVDASLIKTFIANSGSDFNLDAEQIISLTDLGVPADIVNAMMQHDKAVSAAPTATPAPGTAPETAPPTAPVTVTYLNDSLTPYGSWVEVEGYGRCWRPTVVIYDSTWRPYCDRGHWVYTDCGWYWDSDYSWGVTFHYGRWFRHSNFGWCWYPDTVWAPSWVTWRSSDDYCGWAPLPPFSVYRPGVGFFYRNANVSIGFDFGLDADCYTFVSPGHFRDRRPRYYSADPRRATEIFHRTTVINNFNDHDRTIHNGGIPVDRFNTGGRRPIQPVAVAQLPNAGRHGWRGNDTDHRPGSGSSPADNGGRNVSPGNSQLRHGPVMRNDQPNNESRPNRPAPGGGDNVRPPERGQQPQPTTPNRRLDQPPSAPAQSPVPPGNRPGSRDDANRNAPPGNSHQNVTPPARNNPAPGTPVDRNQHRTDPQANNGVRPPPPVVGQPVHSQPVQTSPPAVGATVNNRPAPSAPVNRDQPRNYSSQSERHFDAPVTAPAPVRSQPSSVPVFNSPRNSAPAAPVDQNRWQQRSEPRQSPVVAAPRNATPPAQPLAPAQNQSRGSDRNTGGNSDKDRQNH